MKNEITLMQFTADYDNTFSKQSDITNFPRFSAVHQTNSDITIGNSSSKKIENYQRYDSIQNDLIPSLDLDIRIPISEPIKFISAITAVKPGRARPRKLFPRSLSPEIIRPSCFERNLEAPSSAELLKLKRVRHSKSILKERDSSGTFSLNPSQDSMDQRSVKKVHFNEVVRVKKYPRTKSAIS